MSWRVFKYPLDRGDVSVQYVTMPRGAEVLTVQVQHGVICLWACVDPLMPVETRRFAVVGTGHDDAEGKYIGTVQVYNGDLVFHIFEIT